MKKQSPYNFVVGKTWKWPKGKAKVIGTLIVKEVDLKQGIIYLGKL